MNVCNPVVVAIALLLLPRSASALSTFELITKGRGFLDQTAVEPVGGNTGKTLGEQRRRALQATLSQWEKQLDSTVPIVVEVRFEDLGCGQNGAVLAQASPTQMQPHADDASVFLPAALADAMAGRDLSPGEPDIQVEVNSALDDGCLGPTSAWYYGLDGEPGERTDLITTLLHELGHGLGFASWVDVATGESLLPGGTDVFSAHVYDDTLGKTWDKLTPEERVQSATRTRGLFWSGTEASTAAQGYLARGVPSLRLQPALSGFSGLVGDAGGALNPALHPVSGPVVAASPAHGCVPIRNELMGAVALLTRSPICTWPEAARNALAAGAQAALFVTASETSPAGFPLETTAAPLELPVATLDQHDGMLLTQALRSRSVEAFLAGQAEGLLGADAHGHPLLFAPNPLQRGSSVSHFDSSARPHLLMEPIAVAGAHHDLDLTLPLLHDLGWKTSCGNGKVDIGETCDDGGANADKAGAHCRTNCQLPTCGDGVVDQGETCDDGENNADQLVDHCRTDCKPARCGDGVQDAAEECDRGEANSNIVPDACRSSCRRARCGDGVRDAAESCDGTPDCTTLCAMVPAPMPPTATAAQTMPPRIAPWEEEPSPAAAEGSRKHTGGCSVPATTAPMGNFVWALSLLSAAALWGVHRRRTQLR
ncbi:MAG: hypothetical protein RL385_294 [Pseudomonadota bacterium]